MANDDIRDAYEKVLKASQVQPADDELTALRKLLAQASIDTGSKNEYIRALEQLVKELKARVSELENIVNN